MRLINADKLIRTVRYLTLRDGEEIEIHYVEAERIDSAPTIDAIPVSFIESEIKRMDDEIDIAMSEADDETAERWIVRTASLEFTLEKWRSEREEK